MGTLHRPRTIDIVAHMCPDPPAIATSTARMARITERAAARHRGSNSPRAIFDETGMPAPTITPVSTTEFGARAQRPAHAILIAQPDDQGFRRRHAFWRDALREAVSDKRALAAAIAPPAYWSV